MKPALARNSLFLMAARGQAPGEQAMYLTGTMATLPEPTRLLMEVSGSKVWGLGLGFRVVGWLDSKAFCRPPDCVLSEPGGSGKARQVGAERWVPRDACSSL